MQGVHVHVQVQLQLHASKASVRINFYDEVRTYRQDRWCGLIHEWSLQFDQQHRHLRLLATRSHTQPPIQKNVSVFEDILYESISF